MYIKLLNEAVLEEKGEKPKEKCECKLDLKISAYLPEGYISSASQRMEMYKRIALIITHEDSDDIRDELLDRFGEYPSEVENLLKVAELKSLCERSDIEKVVQNDESVLIYPKQLRIEVWSMLDISYDDYRLKINLTSAPHISFRIPKKTLSVDAATAVVGAYFEKCSQTDNQEDT